MKIFINTTSWAIVKQENETPILAGNNYVDQLKVYYDSNPSTQYFYPTLNILKPNDRKVGSILFDATSVEEPNPSTYTDDDNNTWYMFKFTLSSDNHQIDVSGKYQFTITTNYYNSSTNVITKQRNINTILSVVNAVTNDDNRVLILGSEPGVVIAELYALCQSLQTGVASLQISVSALQSSKADLNNPNQDIVAGSIKAENGYIEDIISEYGAKITLADVYGISFKPAGSSKYITVGDGKISGVDTVEEANDAVNKNYVDTKDALKADLNNSRQIITANKVQVNSVIDGTDTSEIEMTLGAINFYAKNWDNHSQYRQFIFGYDTGLQIDEPTQSYNPTTKNYVDTKDALKLDKENVYNGLDKTAGGFALDARQGKALKDSLDTLYNYVGYATGNDDDTTINKLREIFQFLAGEADDATLLSLLAGKQAKIDSDNKLEADLVDDTTSANKFVSQQEKNQITANKNAIEEIEEAIPSKTSDLTNDSGFIDETYHDNTKQDVLTGSDSVDLTGNVVSVKDNSIDYLKLDDDLTNILKKSNLLNIVDFTNKVDDYFIGQDGAVISANGYCYLPNIELKKGQTIIFVASGFRTAVSMIARQNTSTSFTPLVLSIDSTEHTYTYTTNENIIVGLSCNSALSYRAYIVSYIEDTTEIKDVIDNSKIYTEIDLSNKVDGSFIHSNGTIQSGATGYAYLNNITLKKGETLVVIGTGFRQYVSMISKQVDNTYMPLVISTDDSQHTYTYTAKYDLTFAISFKSDVFIKCYKYYDIDNLTNDKSKENLMCIFPRLAVVGDSLSSGNLTVNNVWEDVWGDSWLSYIARKNNAVSRTHYSNAGATTKSCLEDYLTKIQTDTPFNAYFIALGTNDIQKQWGENPEIPMGTINDTSSDTTFVGYYKKIIEEITTHAPNCAIFCVSLYRTGLYQNVYSDLIRQISELYTNCFYINLVEYLKYYDNSTGDFNENGHYSTLGYNYVANVINDLVNEIVVNNTSFFKMFGKYNSIGTKFED